ncbi:MAG: phosphatase PAP2 family protein [Candidatus Kariarchaeaceae archaeon]
MGKYQKLRDLDYQYSYKLATILPMDSPIRRFFQVATISGTFVFWFIIIAVWYSFFPDLRDEANSMFFVSVVMLAPVFVMKQTIRRKRPEYKDGRFGVAAFDAWSFPSGHATRAAYVMLLMPIYTPQIAVLWIIWGLAMIISRLILGVHYLSDILGGIILSALCISIMFLVDWLPEVPWQLI